MNQHEMQTWWNRIREDFPYYCEKHIRVKNKDGDLVPFKQNKMQLHLWSLIKAHLLLNQKQLRMFLIKLRQGGATTFFTVLFYWLCTLWPYRNALGIAHDESAAKGVGAKWQFYFLTSDPVLRPKVRIMNRTEIHFATPISEFEKTGEVGLDCHLDTFTVDKKEIGRSHTYKYALLTEFARYPEILDAEIIEDRLTGIYNAVPKRPGSIIILESTAAGDNYAKQYWEDTTNGFEKVFISWVSSEEYRRDILPSQYFELTEDEDHRFGDETVERKKIIKQLAFWWPELNTESEIEHEVYCRLAWRREAINELCSGKKLKFRQEYPTSVEDAFSYSGESIFPIDRIVEMEKFIDKSNFKSTRFSYFHDDDTKDKTRKFFEDKYGHLTIYEPPLEGATYVIGADGAQGVPKGDDSSAIVLKLPELTEVACFADIIIPDKFAGILNALGLLYNNALLGCELNDKGGYAAVEKLVNFYHYPNMYYAINPLASKVENNIRWGWITGPNSRQIMIDDFTVNLEEGSILIKSPQILAQCKTFVNIKGKPQAMPGCHDDLVIAIMIARQMVNATHIPKATPPPTKVPKWSVEWHMQRMRIKDGQRKTITRKTLV